VVRQCVLQFPLDLEPRLVYRESEHRRVGEEPSPPVRRRGEEDLEGRCEYDARRYFGEAADLCQRESEVSEVQRERQYPKTPCEVWRLRDERILARCLV